MKKGGRVCVCVRKSRKRRGRRGKETEERDRQIDR